MVDYNNKVNYNNNYLVLNHPIIKSANTLIIILSSNNETTEREKIRETFKRIIKNSISYIFVLSHCGYFDNTIIKENSLYHDILQFDHNDGYEGISLSILHTFNYLSKYYNKFKYILKIDMDTVINFKKFQSFISTNPTGDYFGACHCKEKYSGRRYHPPRNITDYNEFIPCYVYGGGYLISSVIIPEISLASKYLDYVIPYHEDVNTGRIMSMINKTCIEVESWRNNKIENINNTNTWIIIHPKKNIYQAIELYNLLAQ